MRLRTVSVLAAVSGRVPDLVVLLSVLLTAAACTAPLLGQSRGIGPARNELHIEGGDSVGNFHLFGYAENRRLVNLDVEYDHAFQRLFRGELDYTASVLPVILMNEPAKYDASGRALTTNRQEQYGAGVFPVGFRLLWRRAGTLQPYGTAKGGSLYFKNRVLSTEGTHVQYSGEFSAGLEKAVTQRLGFRVGYSDFHFSNGNTGRHNPGIDFMYFNGAVIYRFGGR